ncbi:MAG: VF530 family protein [Bacteroidota bacterium]
MPFRFSRNNSIFTLMEEQKNNPLHNITLEQIMNYLVENYGWDYLGEQININCFKKSPSIKSSLTFLRKTPWARAKVESLYLFVKRKEKKLK